jgi:hypothetical protein
MSRQWRTRAQGQPYFYPSGLDLPFSLSRSGATEVLLLVNVVVVRLVVSDVVVDDLPCDDVVVMEETAADGFIRNTSPNETTSISSSAKI